MEKIKLTRIVRKDADANGNKLMTKDGRPYERLGIQCQEYGQQWLSGFGASWNKDWKDGMVVEVEVKKSPDGKFVNISKPDPLAEMSRTIMDVLKRLTALEKDVAGLKSLLDQPEVEHVEEPPADLDLPF